MGFLATIQAALTPTRRAGPPTTPPADDDFWFEGVAPANAAGMRVTADTALKCATVFRCVTILADILATTPCNVMEILPDGRGERKAPNHPVEDLLTISPNGRDTPADFWGMMGFHAALRGIAYARIKPGPRGAVNSLEVMHPDRVEPELLPDGTLRFRYTDPQTGRTEILLQDEVLRIPGLMSDGVRALRTVEMGSEAIGLLMAADQYAARVFTNKLNIGGFLIHPSRMSPDAQTRLITRLTQRLAGAFNAHRPVILQEGMKFERATMDAKDAQLLEARKWQVREIAQFWGIPLHMIGVDDQTNRSTVEEQSLNFVRYTVRPWINRVEQSLRRDVIIAPKRYKVVFNLDDLERGNMEARANYFAKALGSGGAPAWLTVNEVRIEEGYNPVDDPAADKLAIGTNPSNGSEAMPAGNDNSADDEEAAAGEPQRIEDISADSRAERLARIENSAFSKALVRHAGEPGHMRDWIRAFYGGHVSKVMEILRVNKDVARTYCHFQRDEALRSDDLVALVERREETLASVIAATLKSAGEQ